jgi:Arc/MetJ-type ribon-helix-helix transcriptional regulator
MARPTTLTDLPEDLARFAEAQVAARRFSSVEEVVEAGLESLRTHHDAEPETEVVPEDWTDYLRYRFEQGRAAIARGEFSQDSPAVLMARVRARVAEDR